MRYSQLQPHSRLDPRRARRRPRRGASRHLWVTNPGLRAAQQRYADIATHHQLVATIFQAHLAVVELAVFGVENLPVIPAVTVLLHAADDGHADNRLILACVGASGAAAIGLSVRVETLDHFAGKLAAPILRDLHE